MGQSTVVSRKRTAFGLQRDQVPPVLRINENHQLGVTQRFWAASWATRHQLNRKAKVVTTIPRTTNQIIAWMNFWFLISAFYDVGGSKFQATIPPSILDRVACGTVVLCDHS